MTRQKSAVSRFVVIGMIAGVFTCAPLLLGASAPVVVITIVNNSSREIRHVYLSPPNQDNWSSDQLNGATIAPGGSATLSNVSCSGSEVKVIAEDGQGCFIYQVTSCTENSSWTITNEAAPDCGY
ncbi:MAG TPA: hypothetical protein VJ023_05245 [Pyrinomonadaceae bacterium]|nr:hypothetical protein [Pyrinomonadaceae bacterium]